MSQTYSAVDRSGDPPGAADWQERMARWPAVQAYKRHSYELVGSLAPVLDVGCGTGLDLLGLGRARVAGIDPSITMCLRARRTGAPVCRAAVEALPLRDGSFGACRVDRVLQHVVDLAEAFCEMVRVTRPDGRLVAAEPDQESLVIAMPGVSDDLCDRVKALRRDIGYRNGRLASRLPELFVRLGLADVTVAAFPLVLTDVHDAFGLPGWPRLWRDVGVGDFSDAEIDEWDRAVGSAERDGFVYAVTFFVVSGVIRPPVRASGEREPRYPTITLI